MPNDDADASAACRHVGRPVDRSMRRVVPVMDLADVEAVLRDQGPTFDREWVRRKLAELAGEGTTVFAPGTSSRDIDRP